MNKVAVVTGGTRGIGSGISVALRNAGITVAANFVSKKERAEEFTRATGIQSFHWDVADFDACKWAVNAIEKELGPIAYLINNAGITRDSNFRKMSREMWEEVLQVNLGGCFNMSKNVFEGMVNRGFGRIVNVSSVNAQAGQFGQVNYAAAKAGILGFTKSLALEGARYNVAVNTIAPGYVDTEMVAALPEDVLQRITTRIPVGRLGTVDEIAQAVVFLCSQETNLLTGSTISINGGQYMS